MMTKKDPTRKCGTTQPITEDDYWDDLFQHAAELGLIKDTGKRRDGNAPVPKAVEVVGYSDLA